MTARITPSRARPTRSKATRTRHSRPLADPVTPAESPEESAAKGRAWAGHVVDTIRTARGTPTPPAERTPPPPLPVDVAMVEPQGGNARQVAAWDRRVSEGYVIPARFVAGPTGAVEPEAGDASLRGAQYAAATGMLDPAAALVLLNGVSRALGGLSTGVQRANAGAALLTELRPNTPVEGLLAAQMIATQHAAMLMLERATIREQPSEFVDACVTRAVRLQRVFLEQTAALAKLRGQGAPQRVQVEHLHKHVHVHATPDAARAAADAIDADEVVPSRQLGEGAGGAGADRA